MSNIIRSLCVFCGSNPGVRPEYAEAARGFGRLLADEGIALVYGGGKVGLMGQVADGALEAGGQVVGVIPYFLRDKELAHPGLTELHVTRSMHERKAMMADRADAFVALPGGFGTFDELFEILTWAQLGVHAKPVGLLDVAGFYQPLMDMIVHAVEQGFARPDHLASFQIHENPTMLLAALRQHQAPQVAKWVELSST